MVTLTYDIANTANGYANNEKLKKQLLKLGIPDIRVEVDPFLNSIIVKKFGQLSPAQQSSIDDVVAAHEGSDPLQELKLEKIRAIDKKTGSLVAQGFSYGGKQFSLSQTAQQKISYMHAMKDSLVYPVRVNTKDDLDAINIADASAMDAYCLAAVVAVRTALDSGTALKDLVRAAADVEDVDAIEDNR